METILSPELQIMYAKDLGDGTTEVIYRKRAYTTEETGKIFDITTGQIRILIKQGKIKAVKPGAHKLLITHEEVERLLSLEAER